MIITCSFCDKNLRINASKYSGKRIKLRCIHCGETFFADVPHTLQVDKNKLINKVPQILIAHSDKTLCETVGSLLSLNNLLWHACYDGDSALRFMEDQPPTVAIIDVALPGLFAFEVVDKVRHRLGLESVKIILLSSVYNKMAYKRRPHSLYGADDYIEKHHIPTDLLNKIYKLTPDINRSERIGSLSSANFSEQASSEEAIDKFKDRLLRAEESECSLDQDDRIALEKAQRLARIIASDIVLYDEAKVLIGIQQGTFFKLFESEIAEGRRHFMERVPVTVKNRSAILDVAFADLLERFRKEALP